LYLRRARSYGGPIPPTLGYLPANGKHPPAMIAAFGFCEEPEPGVIDPPADVPGVHITRLTPDGRKAPIDPVKIMLGPSAGLPIFLAPANDLLADCSGVAVQNPESGANVHVPASQSPKAENNAGAGTAGWRGRVSHAPSRASMQQSLNTQKPKSGGSDEL
jgi:hypothetical protein